MDFCFMDVSRRLAAGGIVATPALRLSSSMVAGSPRPVGTKPVKLTVETNPPLSSCGRAPICVLIGMSFWQNANGERMKWDRNDVLSRTAPCRSTNATKPPTNDDQHEYQMDKSMRYTRKCGNHQTNISAAVL